MFGQQPLDAAYMSGSEVTCVPETRMQMDTVDQFSDFHCEELNLYAKSAVLTDADTGRILDGKEANSPMANASTHKDHDLSAGNRKRKNRRFGDFFRICLQYAEGTAWLFCGNTVVCWKICFIL